MIGRISQFLTRMSNARTEDLPLIHTTPAYNLRRIFEEGRIETAPCQFFGNESLSYFFFGRPAYKWETEGDAADWELPVCFVFEYNIDDAYRVFPFDTGAFKSKRLPGFITGMPIGEFEIGLVPSAPGKIVGAFFSSPSNYFGNRCRSEDDFKESLSVSDIESEVRALHKLYSYPNLKSDDRRATVEIQFDKHIELSEKKLIAIILPDIYLADKNVSKYIKDNGIYVNTYDTFPLNSSAYTALIYHRLKEFYKRHGFII